MSGLDRRLERLRLVWRAPEGCDVCKPWWWTVLGNDDGTRSRPECCPDCGRCVPITNVVVAAGVDYRDI